MGDLLSFRTLRHGAPRFRRPGPWPKPARPSAFRRALRPAAHALLFLGFGAFLVAAVLHDERGSVAAVVDPLRDFVKQNLREAPALPQIVRGAPSLASQYTVIDGDSLRTGSGDIRILGIDAPELNQTCKRADGRVWSCGREAQARLRSLIRGGVTCMPEGLDRYGRTLARCTAGGRDVGETLVREGLALDFMHGGYSAAERDARAAGRGLWSGEFDLPQDWRRRSGPRAAR